jgi:hypothetical protein
MRSSRRTALALPAAVLLIGFVAGVFLLVHSSRNQVATATVYATYLGAVTLAVSLLMALGTWWLKGRESAVARVGTREQVCAAADWLAEVIADKWRLEAAARRIVTPAPATVRWHWAAPEVTAQRLDVTAQPAPGAGPPPLPDLVKPGELLAAGVVIRLHDEVYARLPHGRLVLIGGPGAGKTGAMILLLLAALNWRSQTGDQRDRVPVPVWLTLGGWNPAATSLQDWVVSTMERDYPALQAETYGDNAPGDLLRDGRVALFLDGLDEMPEGMRPLALKRLDEARGLRVVLTSRPEEYIYALEAGALDNTAVIELRPVRPDAAATYLLRGQTERDRGKWEKVGAFLRDNPGSVAAKALDNPLALSLARDTYTGQDPTVLTDPHKFSTPGSLIEHLIDRFLLTAYPDERQREYAIRWLAAMVGHPKLDSPMETPVHPWAHGRTRDRSGDRDRRDPLRQRETRNHALHRACVRADNRSRGRTCSEDQGPSCAYPAEACHAATTKAHWQPRVRACLRRGVRSRIRTRRRTGRRSRGRDRWLAYCRACFRASGCVRIGDRDLTQAWIRGFRCAPDTCSPVAAGPGNCLNNRDRARVLPCACTRVPQPLGDPGR